MTTMKDSGIEWIGEIPTSWACKKIKYCYRFETGFTPDTSVSEYYDPDGATWVSISDLTSTGKTVDSSAMGVSDLYLKRKHPNPIPKGSLLYSFKLSVGKCAFASKSLFTNEAIASFLPSSENDLGYLYYASSLIINNANENIYQAKLLNSFLISNAPIPVPSIREQTEIACCLDELCIEIDGLTATITKQISRLQSYRASVIREAVTHGLDPAAPTKPSGIDWIGNVPLSWDVKRLKYTLQFFDHLRAPIEASLRSQEKDTLYPYYGASGAIDVIDDYNVEGDMILIGEDGANLVRRTLPLSYIATGKYWVNNHAHILRPFEGCLRYYYYALEACDYTTFITGSAQPKLSQQKLSNVWLPQPTPSEQSAIADHLDARTSAIDAVLETKRKQLDVLNRRRQSLIYEYVTGKRRVTEED